MGFEDKESSVPQSDLEASNEFDREVGGLMQEIEKLLGAKEDGQSLPEWKEPGQYITSLEHRLEDDAEHHLDSVIRAHAKKLLETKIPKFRERLRVIEEAAA